MELQKTKLVFNKKIPLNFSTAQFKANLQEKTTEKALEQKKRKKEVQATEIRSSNTVQKSKEKIKKPQIINDTKPANNKVEEKHIVSQVNKAPKFKKKEIKSVFSKDQMIQYKHILQKAFPKAFLKNDYVPLYKGIRIPIRRTLNISYIDAVQFIKWYTTRKGYLAKYKVGAWRVDLEGNMIEQITQEIYDLKAKGLNPKKLPLLNAEKI